KTETAVPHLSLNDIKNFGIMVPTLLEQKMIGSFFANLDRLSPFISVSLKNLKISKNLALKRCLCKENRLN
uniref:restriction endonuclease subunit S n=1 Tax=Ruminococcus sp. TaxID=41978 RepID=UPI003AEF41A0